ncbi:hypothetical protein Pcinc_003404 [Petrolisthes cinctipes]|uniref:Peptidase A2 domain-containing protein n=1 Tax=Petrolisthes cinctipes TaxID=88211 RepID=A0AAE1GJ58_PETCI|nr:hypothetical protein Pcinc_003404 [Petrolisthes cinctipes]
MFDQARALESAQKDSEVYGATQLQRVVSVAASSQETSEEPAAVTAAVGSKCFFCGYSRHPCLKCPARESVCHKCHKVCRAASTTATTTSASASRDYATLAAVISAITPKSLSSAVVRVMIKGTEVDGLIDSGSSKSFIHPDVVQRLSLATHSLSEKVAMASTNLSTNTMGFCQVDLKVSGQEYHGVRLTVLPQLCSEVILGQDFQRLYDSVTLEYGGELPPLVVCGLSTLKVDPPKLFANLTADCHSFSAKSRRYSYDDPPVEIPIIEESRNTPVETGENVNKPLDATPSEVTEPVQRVDPLLPLQNSEPCEEAPILRRSERIRHPPVRYEYRKF